MAHVGRCGWPGMHEVCCSAGGWLCDTKSPIDDRCQDKTGRLLQAWVSCVLKFVAAILYVAGVCMHNEDLCKESKGGWYV